jgi:flagellar biosynthesis/type III secretory pathway protein FliH
VINELTNSNLKIEEGKEAGRMCKALEDLIADGRAEGIEAGRQEGEIIGFITACRKIGKTDEEIVRMVTEEFNVNEEDIYKIVALN